MPDSKAELKITAPDAWPFLGSMQYGSSPAASGLFKSWEYGESKEQKSRSKGSNVVLRTLLRPQATSLQFCAGDADKAPPRTLANLVSSIVMSCHGLAGPGLIRCCKCRIQPTQATGVRPLQPAKGSGNYAAGSEGCMKPLFLFLFVHDVLMSSIQSHWSYPDCAHVWKLKAT